MSPIVMNRISWNVLNSPTVDRPTTRVIIHRNRKTITARPTISTSGLQCQRTQGNRNVLKSTETTGWSSTTTAMVAGLPRWLAGWM
jgi:hypothetical protein